MGIIVGNVFLTLDGVYQAPGGPEEDPAGGFEYGGWQAPFLDDASGEAIGTLIAGSDALLLGRRTYDIFSAFWPHAGDDPIALTFNRIPKYVVSTTLGEPSWAGTSVLPDAAAAAQLRERHEEIHTWGSGELLRSLFAEDGVDRLNLWIHPVTLGSGKKLFDADAIPATFRLVEPARTFDKGIVGLVYEPAGEVETGTIGA
jgi:dihydrofolate reductase